MVWQPIQTQELGERLIDEACLVDPRHSLSQG
jgi:hypothetical protein